MSAWEPLSAAELEQQADVPTLLAEVGRLAVELAEARDALGVPPEQITDRAEVIVRSALTHAGMPAEIVQALALAGLLRTEVRPGRQPAAGEVEQLRAELADTRALLAKTVDNMQALVGDGELTVWRAEHDGIRLGRYLDLEEAQAHAEDSYRELVGPAPTLRWYPEEPEDDSVLRLYAQHEGDEVETAYRVVPVIVLTEYTPDGES
ncbi:hypothetical protein E6W39_24445 [Kitasatospora acidiphila]|uniref:Uncharacterized protein n=1 Tax=Kitasatospora acidiphila TaxID=2567942 RepID=A0A540W718_9ACTN|nr:hypothetical protein [Kitasatospora acidiphila]TQF04799.1 hypothetical protein E6W39_24445 [Kitasatospora acidiphila]